jgi:hypothetical protein
MAKHGRPSSPSWPAAFLKTGSDAVHETQCASRYDAMQHSAPTPVLRPRAPQHAVPKNLAARGTFAFLPVNVFASRCRRVLQSDQPTVSSSRQKQGVLLSKGRSCLSSSACLPQYSLHLFCSSFRSISRRILHGHHAVTAAHPAAPSKFYPVD